MAGWKRPVSNPFPLRAFREVLYPARLKPLSPVNQNPWVSFLDFSGMPNDTLVLGSSNSSASTNAIFEVFQTTFIALFKLIPAKPF